MTGLGREHAEARDGGDNGERCGVEGARGRSGERSVGSSPDLGVGSSRGDGEHAGGSGISGEHRSGHAWDGLERVEQGHADLVAVDVGSGDVVDSTDGRCEAVRAIGDPVVETLEDEDSESWSAEAGAGGAFVDEAVFHDADDAFETDDGAWEIEVFAIHIRHHDDDGDTGFAVLLGDAS